MIASYIAYTQLFNSFCAAKMWSKWNSSMSNSYVYEYINNNGQHVEGEKMEVPDTGKIAEFSGQGVAQTGVPKNELHRFFKGAITVADKEQSKLIQYETTIQNFKNGNLRTEENGEMYDSVIFFADRYVDILNFLLDFTEMFEFATDIENDIDSCNVIGEDVLKKANGYQVPKIKNDWLALSRLFTTKYVFLMKLKKKFDICLTNLQINMNKYGLSLNDAINNFLRISYGHDSQDYDDIIRRRISEMSWYFKNVIKCIKTISNDNSVCKEISYTEALSKDGKSIEFGKKYDLLMKPYSVLDILKFAKWIEDIGVKCMAYHYPYDQICTFLGGKMSFFERWQDYMYFIHCLIEKMDVKEGEFGFYVLHYMSNLLYKIYLENEDKEMEQRVNEFVSHIEVCFDDYLSEAILNLASLLGIFEFHEVNIINENVKALKDIVIIDNPPDEFAWFRAIQEKINELTGSKITTGDKTVDIEMCLSTRNELEDMVIEILKERYSSNSMLLIIYIGMQLNEYFTNSFETNYKLLSLSDDDTTQLEFGDEGKELLEKLKKIQSNLLDFIEDSSNAEEKYQNLIKLFDDQKTFENIYEITIILHLINDISMYKYQNCQFWTKIEKILSVYKEQIKKHFENDELFEIFKYNKRLLLFLFEEQFISMNINIYLWLIYRNDETNHLVDYFILELNKFIPIKWEDLPDNYIEKRENGKMIIIFVS